MILDSWSLFDQDSKMINQVGRRQDDAPAPLTGTGASGEQRQTAVTFTGTVATTSGCSSTVMLCEPVVLM